MPQPPAMIPEATALFTVLAGSIAVAVSIYPGLNRDAAFFMLGAAACGICCMAFVRRNRASGSEQPALQLLECAADELKKTLHTINGLSEAIGQWSAREGAEWRDSCDHLVETTRRLALFSSQLHDYARLERGTLRLLEQQVDAAELATAALGACEDKAESADIFINADLSGSAELHCDALRIRQAVTGLLHWVIETSPSGSSIDVRMQRTGDNRLEIRILNLAGVSANALTAALFEPPVPLTGLNSMALPIARRLALLHGGDVKVGAAPGAGTSATLSLPAYRVEWPETAETIAPGAS